MKEYDVSYDIDEEGREYISYDETWNGIYNKPSDVIKYIERTYDKKVSKYNLSGFGEEWYYGNYSNITYLKRDENLNIDNLLDAMRENNIDIIRSIINSYINKNKDK